MFIRYGAKIGFYCTQEQRHGDEPWRISSGVSILQEDKEGAYYTQTNERSLSRVQPGHAKLAESLEWQDEGSRFVRRSQYAAASC